MYGFSAAAVALPEAARRLHISALTLTWILTAYAAGVGVGAVAAGRLIDLWGSRRVLVIAAALLATGALLCVLAPILAALITGRILLAVGAGAIQAAVLSGAARLPARPPSIGLAVFGACLAGFSATAPLAGAEAARALTMHLSKIAAYGAGDLLTRTVLLYAALTPPPSPARWSAGRSPAASATGCSSYW